MPAEHPYLTDSIEEIKKRLENIEKAINKIELMERAEIKYINSVKDMESKELEGLNDIALMENHELKKMDKLKPLKYNDIMLWKNAIWEECTHKVMIESSTMVLFNCDITNKSCSFGSCPRNIAGRDNI
ncbi:MAG: hypothetical protein ACP5OA_04050 [Candidatus Woesearchaeota archaeon]